jgi:ABC-type multidrug transport system ATPase subunit
VTVLAPLPHGARAAGAAAAGEPAVEALGLDRRFGGTVALRGATLVVAPGEVRALLGLNGAGKTTLLRILAGLVEPHGGEVRVAGTAGVSQRRRLVGLIPSGDRSFYLRISGLENLAFFARLQGMRRRRALERARELLALVGLADAAHRRAGEYSHGMQKRLSVARALLCDPPVLLVDEATHDLDPEGAGLVRALVRDAADRCAAVIWATQRLDEIRGFADSVTVLRRGESRFAGTVGALLEHATPRRHLVQLDPDATAAVACLQAALGPLGRLSETGGGHLLLDLASGGDLGSAVAAIAATGARVVAVRQERSEVEEAFLSLVREEPA